MKKKYLAPAVMALIVVISTAAISCGKQADKEANATEPETTVETSTEVLETTAPAETETSETTASVKESDDTATTEAPETTPAETEKTPARQTVAAKKETAATAQATVTATPKTTAAPASKAAQPTQTTAAPAPVVATAPTEATQPAHQHVWKDHIAVRQEWVSNIVSIPDYATQSVKVGTNTICNCGAVNPSPEHAYNHMINGEADNFWYEDIYEEQTVQVGSHDEDQGYYKDVEYVDYQYCDCGAKK